MNRTLKWRAKYSRMKTTPFKCIDEHNKWCASCFWGSLFLLVNWTWPEIHFNQTSYDKYVLVQGSIDWDSSQKLFEFLCCNIKMNLDQPFEHSRPNCQTKLMIIRYSPVDLATTINSVSSFGSKALGWKKTFDAGRNLCRSKQSKENSRKEKEMSS